jgi:hypothetical protein
MGLGSSVPRRSSKARRPLAATGLASEAVIDGGDFCEVGYGLGPQDPAFPELRIGSLVSV